MDQLAAMRVFVMVADRGNQSAAARALGIPLASVSRKIGALEARLRCRLLARTTRRTALTDAGRQYLETCRRVLAEVDEADRSLALGGEELRGSLAVSAPIVFGRLHVLPIVQVFLEQHPAVDVRLVLVDRMVDLVQEDVDVAVRIGALPDSTLVGSRVGWVRRVTCASPAYLEKRGVPLRPADLGAHDCVTLLPLSSDGRWSYAEPHRRGMRAVSVRSRLVVSTAEAALDAAEAGLGITRLLSYQTQRSIAEGRVRALLENFEPAPVPVNVLQREARHARPKVGQFVALAVRELRRVLRGHS